ncbi:MAG TPA: DUF6152 family protein [Gammaproteobacteria bacterium]|nr:DUF6152 family protein [Gammaproteobacteria bacterium]
MNARYGAATLAALLCGLTAQAHHGRASYGNEHITLQATVTEFKFINPHVQIYFDVTSEAGEIEHWQGELTAPNKLARAGWTKSTFQPGDHLTISGRAARNDGRSVAIDEILTADGESLPLWEILD